MKTRAQHRSKDDCTLVSKRRAPDRRTHQNARLRGMPGRAYPMLKPYVDACLVGICATRDREEGLVTPCVSPYASNAFVFFHTL